MEKLNKCTVCFYELQTAWTNPEQTFTIIIKNISDARYVKQYIYSNLKPFVATEPWQIIKENNPQSRRCLRHPWHI